MKSDEEMMNEVTSMKYISEMFKPCLVGVLFFPCERPQHSLLM